MAFDTESEKSKELLEKAEGLLLKKEAEEDDAGSTWSLGDCHCCGNHGFSKDLKLCYEWCEQSADLKHLTGMANAGWCHANGIGVEKNPIDKTEAKH